MNTQPRGVSRWLELRIVAPGEAMEALSALLADAGSCGSIFSEDPQMRPGLEALTAFFPEDDSLPQRLAGIEAGVSRVAVEFPHPQWGKIETWTIEAQDWLSGWKERFQPAQLTPRVWVVPSWCAPPPAAQDAIVIRIDPGLAFGTGLHATTRSCIRALERLVPGRATSVLDLGTGTGILAIVSARLGAKRVLAVDLDPQAINVARENLAANGLQNCIELKVAGADPRGLLDDEPFDLLVANLFSEELIRIQPLILRHLAGHGLLVLSGILDSQAPRVISSYTTAGMQVEEKIEDEEWKTVILARK